MCDCVRVLFPIAGLSIEVVFLCLTANVIENLKQGTKQRTWEFSWESSGFPLYPPVATILGNHQSCAASQYDSYLWSMLNPGPTPHRGPRTRLKF